MKQKLFRILCCLLLSASMVTQAQAIALVDDGSTGGVVYSKANLIGGRNKAPQAVYNISWTWVGDSHFIPAGYQFVGTYSGYKVYKYQWDDDLKFYFSWTAGSEGSWYYPTDGQTYVMPPKGDYTIQQGIGNKKIANYDSQWTGSWTNSIYIDQSVEYFWDGTLRIEEGADGPYIHNATSSAVRTTPDGNGTYSYNLVVGSAAVYRTVNVVSNVADMGTATYAYKSGYVYTPTQDFKNGSVYTLTAAPKSAKYSFVEWQKNGSRISTSATTDVTIDGDATYTAVFECTGCSGGTITAEASPAAGGNVSVSPSGSQSGGTYVTLTATPNSGYQFTQWNDGNTTNPRTVCVDGDENYTATFIMQLHDYEYHFTWTDDVVEAGCGSVASGGNKTSNRWYCLRTQILKNYVHTGAMGYPAINIDITTSQTANTENGYKAWVSGRYLPYIGTYTNSTNSVGNNRGYIIKSGTSGSTSCFTKFYDQSGNAYTFQSGSIKYMTASSGSWPFILVDGTFGGHTVWVTIGNAPTYTITLNNSSATTAGTTSVTAHYTESTNLTSPITLPTKNGYTFAGYWTGNGGTGTQVIDAEGNFIGGVTVNTTKYTDALKRWLKDSNTTLYAKWTEKPTTYTLTLDITGEGTVTAYSDNNGEFVTFTNNEAEIEEDDNITITYTPAPGYRVGSFDDSEDHSMPSGYDFFMEGPRTITVVFEPDANITTYTLTLNAGPHGTVTVYNNTKNYNVTFTNNEAQIAEDDEIVITYTPAAGYHVGTHTDSEEGNINSGEGIFMGGDHTITVTFEPDVYNITYKDKGNVAFTGTHGSGYPTTHTYGTATALVNPTKANATFGGWYENSACTGAAVTSIAATAKTADFTLYAKWRGTITANASGSGSVSGAGTYDVGANVSLTATPSNSNYYLYDWEKDGVSLGVRTNPLVQSVTANAAYTAIFREKEWTLTVNSDNPSLGTASGSGKYFNGENTTLVATPANSFTSFVKWQKNGVDIAGGASLNVTVNANDTYTAFFSGRNIIEVDIDASYTDRGSIYSLRGYSSDNKYYVDAAFYNSNDALYSVDGITYNSSSLSFTTKTSEGYEQPCGNRVITHLLCYNATGDVYRFNIHWSFPWGNDNNDTFPNDRTINANQQAGYDSDLNAIYVYGYTKDYEWNGQATLRAMGMYFVTSLRCSDAIKLPEGTYDINCSGEPGTVMSYQSGMDKDLSGGWAQTQGVEHGYYLLDKGTVTVTKSGSTYTITVNAKNSYGNDLKGTLTMDESVISGTIPSYTLNVTTDGHGTASVKRYDCNGDLNAVSNSGSYKQGSYFRLEATANAGYAFDYWTLTGSSEHFDENPIELEGLYANATVTAHFKSAYALAWDANGGVLEGTAGEDYTPAGYYAAGTSITAPTATKTGYTFTGWSPAFTGTMPSANTTYTAQWTANTYNVSFAAGEGSGTMTDQVFTYGVAQNLKANTFTAPTATATYNYNGATGGNTPASVTVTATADGWFDGNSNYYEEEQSVNNLTTTNGATVALTAFWGWYEEITLPTPTKTGYEFDQWTFTMNDMPMSEDAGAEIPIEEDVTMTAHWNIVTYDLTYEGLNGATNSNPATYDVESETIVLADPGTRDGYVFTGWTCGGDAITQITHGSTGDKTITANWNAKLSAITLEDNRENSFYNTFKTTYDGATGLIVTYARQFTQGRWSTLCLPFNVNKAMFNTLNFGSRIYEFKYATGNADDGVNLYFSIAKSIEAGKGYIVNADAKLAARTSFTFSGVTMDLSADNGAELNSVTAYDNLTGNSSEGNIELVGTLRKGTLKGTAADNRYMGLKENKIYYPNIATGSTILAYRGIFRSIDGTLNAERIRIIVDGEEKAELEVINGELQDVQETRKFIENGVLYIERNGVIYDATGRKVE